MFDSLIPDFLRRYRIPGAAVAVAKDGRLVLAQGYGLADVQAQKPVQPDSLFRVASISKPITAVAILKLMEEGALNLEEKVFEILDEFITSKGTVADPRINDITVRHLLEHSGGWDSNKSYDPMWVPFRVERELGVSKPVTCHDVITYMLTQPLDFDPGTDYAYSNFGYCLLGRVIEAKTHESYEEFVSEQVFEPIGIDRMRIGGTLIEDKAVGEVIYYGYPDQRLTRSVLSDEQGQVPGPYGGFNPETMDAHGGWVGSAIDLLRFATSIDGSRPPRTLDAETVGFMVDRPNVSRWKNSQYYYSLGWLVRPVNGDGNWWHDGSLPGTTSLLVRAHNGLVWAILMNSRPRSWHEFGIEVDRLMWRAIRQVSHWPNEDLFDGY